jgi:hypothetical protein
MLGLSHPSRGTPGRLGPAGIEARFVFQRKPQSSANSRMNFSETISGFRIEALEAEIMHLRETAA